MKPFVQWAILLSVAFHVSAFGFASSEVAVTVRVKDDKGVAIKEAQTTIGFETNRGFGVSSADFLGNTDENGELSANGKTSGYVVCTAAKAGYYRTTGNPVTFQRDAQGRWGQDKAAVDLVLKRRTRPIAMYARIATLDLPVMNEPCAYDLAVGGWVNPYGKGVNADLTFRASKTTKPDGAIAAELTLKFANAEDGVQSFIVPGRYGSELRSDHEAPEIGYANVMVWSATLSSDLPLKGVNEEMNYYFRVRSKATPQGELISAQYGKIYGDIEFYPFSGASVRLRFKYYLNPEPNDRNVEFDVNRNLFRNLGVFEAVASP